MNFFLETLRVIGLTVYFTLEYFVLLFIPVRKKNVTGEIVLITGAGSGIGRLMALKFARLGATLVLWDISVEGNKETARLARKNGAVRVHNYTCDCSKRQEVYQVADQVKKEVGDVSILINNAGIVTGKKFLDSPDAMIQKSMEVNTMAHFWLREKQGVSSPIFPHAPLLGGGVGPCLLCSETGRSSDFSGANKCLKGPVGMTVKAFLPAMVASNHGHVVTIASAAGLVGVTGLADYCASKFAAVGFAESLGLEILALGKTGIKSTIVCPFFINTGMFDGCQTKWPRLLPVLDADYAAERIVSGILRNQVYVYIPRSIAILIALKGLIPTKVGVILGDYIGYFHFMETFTGRANKIEDNKSQ